MTVSAPDGWGWALCVLLALGGVASWALTRSGKYTHGSEPLLRRRLLVQALLAAVALIPPRFGAQPFGFALAAFMCAAAYEVCNVLSRIAPFARGLRTFAALAPAVASLVFVSAIKPPPVWLPLGLGALGFVIPWLLYSSRGAFRQAFVVVAALLWPGAALLGMALLGSRRTLALDVTFLYGAIEVNELVSYLVDRGFGKHVVWPAVSPRKSWEGVVAGLGAAALTGLLLSFLQPALSPALCGVLALLLAAFGLLADLSGFALKRAANAQEFGSWLGTHGGFMDAYDSFVLVAPLWCVLLSVFSG